MSISSEQYKTALFEQCRRAIRVPDETYRTAWYDMVYKILEHDGVVVDETGYTGFKNSLEGYLRYLSDNNIITGRQIHDDDNFVTVYDQYWGTAFAGIGITTTCSEPSSGTVNFYFTYSDGTQESYTISDYGTEISPAEMNIRFYSTLGYARDIQEFWSIEPTEDTIPLNEMAGNRASFVTNWGEGGLYWKYGEEEIEIYGEGNLTMVPARFTGIKNGIGLGNVKTAYYGAGVKALPTGAFDWGAAGSAVNIICYHGADDPVTLAGNLSTFTNANNPYTLHIYCDNNAIRNATFGAGAKPQWHSLTEWPG